MERLIAAHLLKGMRGGVTPSNMKALLRAPAQPGPNYVLFEHFWVEAGGAGVGGGEGGDRYVLTESVREHLKNLARAVLVRKYPILLQVKQGESVM